MRKRFLSILTALALALSLLPVTALAAGESTEGLPTPDGNNVYTLSADTTVTSVGWPQTSAAIDLGGHTLTMSGGSTVNIP